MTDETDFLNLYSRLGLEPGCTLSEFKQAYRRSVAQWHPDRRRGTRADALAAARLQRLTAQYGAAMDFHRRHGRLPGAHAMPRAVAAASDETAPVYAATAAEAAGEVTSARGLTPRWLMLVTVIGVAAVVWTLLPAAGTPDAADAGNARPQVAHAAPVAVVSLRQGMDEAQVVAIEGEPTRRGQDQWEYGPSWVRFDHGAVSDWYSSPLHGLHVDTARAAP